MENKRSICPCNECKELLVSNTRSFTNRLLYNGNDFGVRNDPTTNTTRSKCQATLREVKSPIINEDVADAFVISEDVTDVMVTSIQRHTIVTYLQCRPKQPLIPSDGLGSSLIFTANYISQTYRECQEITSSLPSRSLASSAN
jgi:hypothetical protein